MYSVQCHPSVFVALRFHIIQETFGRLIITSLSACLCELTVADGMLRADLFVLERVRSCSCRPINEEMRLASVHFTQK